MTIHPASEWPRRDGVYVIPADVYHATRLPSNSLLTRLAQSPRHAYVAMTTPVEPTPAMRFGSAAHAAVLEPMDFMTRYDTARQCLTALQSGERCTATGKVRIGGRWFCGRKGHAPEMDEDAIEVISPEDFARVTAMQEAVRKAAAARAILDQPGGFEVSVIWTHEPTGLRVKCRADFYSASAAILADYKTTTDASPAGFSRKLYDFGYHRQAAMYLDAFAAIGSPLADFAFIAQEKEAPYAVGVYRIDDASVMAGRQELDRLLRIYADCDRSGEWPAYDTSRVIEIGLPTWALNRIYEEDEQWRS